MRPSYYLARFCYILALFFTVGCVGLLGDSYNPSFKFYYRHSPIDINIDATLSPERQYEVAQALRAWEIASSETIKFRIHFNVSRPNPKVGWPALPRPQDGIYLWYLDPQDPNYTKDEKERAKYNHLNGLYVPGSTSSAASVIIFKNPRMANEDLFLNTVLHEVGHLLGIHHLPQRYAVVYEFSNYQTCISQFDALALCKIYDCKPVPGCEVPNV